jgi:hypothetical protein
VDLYARAGYLFRKPGEDERTRCHDPNRNCASLIVPPGPDLQNAVQFAAAFDGVTVIHERKSAFPKTSNDKAASRKQQGSSALETVRQLVCPYTQHTSNVSRFSTCVG